jgi:hypothetical protein
MNIELRFSHLFPEYITLHIKDFRGGYRFVILPC